MSLSSIAGAGTAPLRPNPYAPNADALRTRTEATRPGAAPVRPAPLGTGSLGTLGQGAATLPAEAPEGTDPALWSVLTNDERAFFAKAGSLGPLTYGRATQSTAAAPATSRGGRLDVRA